MSESNEHTYKLTQISPLFEQKGSTDHVMVTPILKQIEAELGHPDLLLVVPPFVKANRPSFALHLLQAIAKADGINTSVLYSNLILHKLIGPDYYDKLTIGSGLHPLIGDLVFRQLAYPDMDFAQSANLDDKALHKRLAYLVPKESEPNLSETIQPTLETWLQLSTDLIKTIQPKIVGVTSTFDQNNASISLINAIKSSQPDIITLLGGANCEDEMSDGIASLNSKVDYIFSGESDTVFLPSLKKLLSGRQLDEQVIRSQPVMNLNDSPLPCFEEFYQQYSLLVDKNKLADIALPFETSRGCWWGQKHHCTFCGLNGDGMTFRFKKAEKVTSELIATQKQHQVKKVQMVDNIMPVVYFKDLLPELSKQNLGLEIFYEQKANLAVDKLLALKAAGITVIQPGIESFSTRLLKLMDKGVSGAQNLLLLRNSKSLGLSLAWNLLHGFPGDRLSDYKPTYKLISSIMHLQPPVGFFQLSLDRFSMYHKAPKKYAINNLRPLAAYDDVYPTWANKNKLAYYFEGDYYSEIMEDANFVQKMDDKIRQWQDQWLNQTIPIFHFKQLSEKTVMLIDNRFDINKPVTNLFPIEQAYQIAMPSRIKADHDSYLENHWGIVWDDQYVPVMTVDQELLLNWNKLP